MFCSLQESNGRRCRCRNSNFDTLQHMPSFQKTKMKFTQMMQSVAERFEAAVQRANPTEAERQRAIERHQAVSEVLKRTDFVECTFLSGSYARDTATCPLHDVDMFVVLKESAHTVDSAREPMFRCLQIVASKLGCKVQDQEHSVGLVWNDGLNVDVIPARPLQEGYQIGARTLNGWKATFPRQAKEAITAANTTCNRLIPLIKVLKVWNLSNQRKTKKPFKSVHLEVMCYSAAEQLSKSKNDRHRVRGLFLHLCTQVSQNLLPPGGGEPLNKYLLDGNHWSVEEVRTLLFDAGKMANDAVSAEDSGDEARAHQTWEKIFGRLYSG